MQITHALSLTVADATGTATIWNGTTTSTIAATGVPRPGDWNAKHALQFTFGGNTTNASTVSGTAVPFAGTGGISIGGSNGSVLFSVGQNATVSTYVPYFPASTSSQTLGAKGTSTASALVFPVPVYEDIAFNAMRILYSASYVTSTISGQQSISSGWGLYTNNAGTLSQISSGSFSLAMTVSSVSATINLPTSTNTAGYTTGSLTITTTAQGQSLIGTAGNRVADLVFGGSVSLSPGLYYVGLHQRQSTSSANIGISTGLIGNAMNATSAVGALGSSTAAFSATPNYHLGAHGFYTSTGSAGYSGTTLPASMIMTGFKNNLNVMPMVTFLST